ncbi:MAG: PilZ domain-containing protein [Pseudomonadota bacterium]
MSAPPTDRDRREAPRLSGQHDVLIKVLHADRGGEVDGRIYTCATDDISRSGLRLTSSVPFPVNGRLDLRLRAGTEQFVLTGRVRWSSFDGEHHSAGIRFEADDGDDAGKWNAWVSDQE